MLIALPLAAGPAQSQEILIDFEDFTGPGRIWAADPPLTVEDASFSGGAIATDVARLRSFNDTSVYGTRNGCDGCAKAITIEFSKTVSGVSFLLMNARLADQIFEIEDDTGHLFEIELKGYLRPGSRAIITLPSSKIGAITIQQTTSPSSGFRRFYIDNLRYTLDDGAQYQVSFSAFVPHDNVVAAPTALCLFNGNMNARDLNKRGAMSNENSRWGRDGDFNPVNGRPLVVRSGETDSETDGNRRQLYFAGDNRDFQPSAPSYRLRQTVMVIPDVTEDADGVEDGSVQNLAGDELAFAEDAMADGVIDARDDDGISDDCRLFHQANRAATDGMNVEVTRNGPQSVQIRFSGALDSPLMGPAETLGQIDWDFTLTLDRSYEPAAWFLTGAHDGFPAYEIYINGTPVYQHDPGPAPYDFARQVQKLLPPLDVEFAETSGDLP